MDDTWSSKAEAAAWARRRATDPDLVDRALSLRAGRPDERLDPARVADFVGRVLATVTAAKARE